MSNDDVLQALALERCQFYAAQLQALSYLGKESGILSAADYASVLGTLAEKLSFELGYLRGKPQNQE